MQRGVCAETGVKEKTLIGRSRWGGRRMAEQQAAGQNQKGHE